MRLLDRIAVALSVVVNTMLMVGLILIVGGVL